MIDFTKKIQKSFSQKGPLTKEQRLKLYDDLHKALEKDVQQGIIPKDQRDKTKALLEKAINESERDYLLIEKLRISSSNDKKIEKPEEIIEEIEEELDEDLLLEKSLYAQKPQTDKKHVINTQNPIAELILNAKKSMEKAQQKQRLIRALKIFALLFLILLIFFGLFLTFFTDRETFFTYHNQKTIDNKREETHHIKKLTYRLLPDGSEESVPLSTGKDETSSIKKQNHPDQTSLVNNLVIYNHYNLKTGPYKNHPIDQASRQKENIYNHISWRLKHICPIPNSENDYVIEGESYIKAIDMHIYIRLRQNYSSNQNVKYIADVSFIPSKNHPIDIKRILDFGMKASIYTKAIGFQSSNPVKISENYFLYPFQNDPRLLKNDLTLLREAQYFVLQALDQDNNVHEITFPKGKKGTSIFNDVINQWIRQKE